MILENRGHMSADDALNGKPTVEPSSPVGQLEHLLKVVGSVGGNANKAWTGLWGELKRCATPGGRILPEAEKGFVPSCGWPEFLETFWELKHYLDCIQRICSKEH